MTHFEGNFRFLHQIEEIWFDDDKIPDHFGSGGASQNSEQEGSSAGQGQTDADQGGSSADQEEIDAGLGQTSAGREEIGAGLDQTGADQDGISAGQSQTGTNRRPTLESVPPWVKDMEGLQWIR